MIPQPAGGFEWLQATPQTALVCAALQPYAAHLFTTRAWALGSSTGDDRAAWDEVAGAIGVDRDHLARTRQVHGATVVVRRRGEPAAAAIRDADILVSDDPSLALAIQTADCNPLLVADRRQPVVAAAHAGWRGLAAGVPRVAVEALARAFGSRPADLIAISGPSIGACCYEVGADVLAAFRAAGFARPQLDRWFSAEPSRDHRNPPIDRAARPCRPNHWFFDGWTCARDQLAAAGLAVTSIHCAELCTASHATAFCSYRRDGVAAGRLAAVIRAAQR